MDNLITGSRAVLRLILSGYCLTPTNMNEITDKYYSAEEFIDYKANVEQPLPMICQSGYLTTKDFDWEGNTFFLDYPNKEVKRGEKENDQWS